MTTWEPESDDKAEYFRFLDTLRTSGSTNMFGAASNLMDEFGLTKREADSVLWSWMGQHKIDRP